MTEPRTAKLEVLGNNYELPIIEGSEGEIGLDITKLRSSSGCITLDNGYGNTGSCESAITFVDGEKGILQYRGYPIEEVAKKLSFVDTAYLVIWGKLPTPEQRTRFSNALTENAALHSGCDVAFNAFPQNAHPMAIMSAMVNVVSCYHPDLLITEADNNDKFLDVAARIISQTRTIAASPYRKSRGLTMNQPNPNLSYCSNFLHMMFSNPYQPYEIHPDVEKALNLFLILHADHEQNCSTASVRVVGSSGANLFSSVSAGICALWGKYHGGANARVLDMLTQIHETGKKPSYFTELAKTDPSFKMMGFGHRVYKNFDPRAIILKTYVDKLTKLLNKTDPLFDIAAELADIAVNDDYFKERKLYPNVDFYSGLLLKALDIPIEMFTVMFAIGRMPGWIANWKEFSENPKRRISRPRQIYQGETKRSLSDLPDLTYPAIQNKPINCL
jgi:citrate synthase